MTQNKQVCFWRNKNKYQPFFYRTNWQIRTPTVRLINEQKKQIGVMPIEEARKIANEEGLDLVEIVTKANPPIVQLIAYSKFKYQEEKRRRKEKKKQVEGVKEFQMKPFIAKEDLANRIGRIKDFLKKGIRIKIIIKFIGRQIEKKEFGYSLLERIRQDIAEFGAQETEPRLIGRNLIVVIIPKKNG